MPLRTRYIWLVDLRARPRGFYKETISLLKQGSLRSSSQVIANLMPTRVMFRTAHLTHNFNRYLRMECLSSCLQEVYGDMLDILLDMKVEKDIGGDRQFHPDLKARVSLPI